MPHFAPNMLWLMPFIFWLFLMMLMSNFWWRPTLKFTSSPRPRPQTLLG